LLMSLPFKKFRQRLLLLSVSAGYNLIPIIFNVVMAALVVRLLNASLWGEMVQVLLWAGIAGNIIAWGNKDYLVRDFSAAPTALGALWQQSFGSRSSIVALLLVLLIFLPLSLPVKGWTALYLVSRFIYMSYDSVIVFKRNFITTILLELLGFILTGAGIYCFHPADLQQLLGWFAGAEFLKTLVLVFLYRKEVLPVFFKGFTSNYFVAAFSFFLLYFTSMLASKIDLICVTSLFSKTEVARYQVLMSFLQATQLSIPILLLPYLRIIYRLPVASIRKMAFRLLIVGMMIASAAVFTVSVILEFVYRFHYDPVIFFLGWLIVVPGFYYAPLIYRLFKNNRQQVVVVISCIFICCSAGLILLLLNSMPLSFTAVFVAMALAQWLQGITYFFVGRKIT
ncbi:MAG: hypothetical protein ABIO46_01710, partial [Chitinophagales bacterium]